VIIVVLAAEDGNVSKMRWIYPDFREDPAKGTIERVLSIILNSKIDVSLLRFWISDFGIWIGGIASLYISINKTDRSTKRLTTGRIP
jgi:hypothetical protein